MKKLIVLVLLVAAGVGGYLWYRTSVLYVMAELKDATDDRDAARFEQHCDLDKVAQSALNFSQAVAEESARDAAGNEVGSLVKGLASLLRTVTDVKAKEDIKDEIRAAIAEGRARELLGEFRPEEGYSALEGVGTLDDNTSRVTFKGICEGGPASVSIDFEKVPDGGLFGLGTWRCTGMGEKPTRRLAKACVQNSKASRK